MSIDCFNLSSRLQDLVIVQALDPKVILKENKMKIIMKYYAIKENNFKMTQKEICEKLGISTRTFARYKLELGCKEEIKTGKKYKRLHYVYDEEMDEFNEDKNGDYIWSNKESRFKKDDTCNSSTLSSRKEMNTAKRNKLHQQTIRETTEGKIRHRKDLETKKII